MLCIYLKECISAVSNYVIFVYWLKFRSSNLHICGIKALVTILILSLLKQTNTLSLIVPEIRTGIFREDYFPSWQFMRTIFIFLFNETILFKTYVYWTVYHCDSWRIKDQLDVTCYLFHFLCAQHVSDINISIIRSLRLFCWITTLVVLFLVRCVLEFRCGWVGVVSVLQEQYDQCGNWTE